MKTIFGVLLISIIAQADLPEGTIPASDLHQEIVSAPNIESIESHNADRDLKIVLDNGMEFDLPLSSYDPSILRGFESLGPSRKKLFLKFRKAMMTMISKLSNLRVVNGGFIAVKDGIYYVGRKSKIIKDMYNDSLERHQPYRNISVLRPEIIPEAKLKKSEVESSRARLEYSARINDFYSKLVAVVDKQLVLSANAFSPTEIAFEVGIPKTAIARGGTYGVGGTVTTYFSLAFNWKQMALFGNIYGDHERSLASVGLNFGAGVHLAVKLNNRIPGQLPEAVESGTGVFPPGFLNATSVGGSTAISTRIPLSAFAASGLALWAGQDPWVVVGTLLGTSMWDLAQFSTGPVIRYNAVEIKGSLNLSEGYARRLGGYFIISQAVQYYMRAAMSQSTKVFSRVTDRVATVANRFRNLDDLIESRSREYKPRSCNLLFQGPVYSETKN